MCPNFWLVLYFRCPSLSLSVAMDPMEISQKCRLKQTLKVFEIFWIVFDPRSGEHNLLLFYMAWMKNTMHSGMGEVKGICGFVNIAACCIVWVISPYLRYSVSTAWHYYNRVNPHKSVCMGFVSDITAVSENITSGQMLASSVLVFSIPLKAHQKERRTKALFI